MLFTTVRQRELTLFNVGNIGIIISIGELKKIIIDFSNSNKYSNIT